MIISATTRGYPPTRLRSAARGRAGPDCRAEAPASYRSRQGDQDSAIDVGRFAASGFFFRTFRDALCQYTVPLARTVPFPHLHTGPAVIITTLIY